jgi:hypothetical protein
MLESADAYCALSKDDIVGAKAYAMKYGKGSKSRQDWEIIDNTEHIMESPLELPDVADLKVELDLPNMDLADLFFNHNFPEVEGHGQLIDEYLSNSRKHATTQQRKRKSGFMMTRILIQTGKLSNVIYS